MTKRVRREDGFSVAEVVIASAILFFVITAMIGLVGASQKMTVTAKQRTVVTNAVAEHIERLRALDYSLLKPTAEGGSLQPVDEYVLGDYKVIVNNRIVYPDGEGGKYLKTVYVTATCLMGTSTYTSQAVVNIKNPRNDTTAASLVDPDLPVIEIISPTPAPDSVLYGKTVHPGQTRARIKCTVRSPSDTISEVQYKVGTTLVRDSRVAGTDAYWTFDGLAYVTTDSDWDTQQEGVRDGFQTVRVIAKDDQDRVATAERRFIIDNEVPGVAGAPVGESITASRARMTFSAAPDPVGQTQTFATRYLYYLYKEPISGGPLDYWSRVDSGTVPSAPTTITAMTNGGTITAQMNTQPFSRYWAKVHAGSPRDFNWAEAGQMAVPFVSRPQARSDSLYQSMCVTNYTTSGGKTTTYATTIYLTKPNFPYNTSSLAYTFYVKPAVAGAAWTPFDPAAGWNAVVDGDCIKVTFTYSEAQNSRQLWFKVGVSVVPSGVNGGVATPSLLSNAIGVTGLDSDGRGGFKTEAVLMPDTTWTE